MVLLFPLFQLRNDLFPVLLYINIRVKNTRDYFLAIWYNNLGVRLVGRSLIRGAGSHENFSGTNTEL